mmetsp:Transcript_7079/g.21593  ORF Transcript_7079/g.21593 Transcript_7079/m.21593 type:complete len:400 (+) Transcript_7079:276-1475(+)
MQPEGRRGDLGSITVPCSSQDKQAGRGRQMVCVNDFRDAARDRVPVAVLEYAESGAEDESAMHANVTQFKRLFVIPRMLRSTQQPDTSINIFDSQASCPIFVSPFGLHTLAHPHGEIASARAASRHEMVFGMSQHSSKSIAEVFQGAPKGTKWFQPYILKRRGVTERLIRDAQSKGCKAIVVTADSPIFGFRMADTRNGFTSLPGGIEYGNYRDDTSLADIFEGPGGIDDNIHEIFDVELRWSDIEWVKSITPLPLIVKGLLHASDAICAAEAGADGIILSNHGGRQLGCAVPPLVTLREVQEALKERGYNDFPVMIDGGIRSGDDILKALALGARAVGIARPVFWGLASGGEDAVYEMLAILRKELERSMCLAGCTSLEDVRHLKVTTLADIGVHPKL